MLHQQVLDAQSREELVAIRAANLYAWSDAMTERAKARIRALDTVIAGVV